MNDENELLSKVGDQGKAFMEMFEVKLHHPELSSWLFAFGGDFQEAAADAVATEIEEISRRGAIMRTAKSATLTNALVSRMNHPHTRSAIGNLVKLERKSEGFARFLLMLPYRI